MRFADAKPDGRAIVSAHIQADPLVARIADLLSEATTTQRVLSRAAMNGESTDPATWRSMFPSLFGPAAPDRAEVGDVLPLVLDRLGRGGEHGEAFEGLGDAVGDGGGHARRVAERDSRARGAAGQ